jgi:hypothetical protein
MIEKITCMNCHCKLGVKDTHLFDGNPYCDECYYFASGRYLSSGIRAIRITASVFTTSTGV